MKHHILSWSLFTVAVFLILLLPLCSADLGTFKQGDCVNIKTILNSTWVNISSVTYPNSTTAITNDVMSKIGATWNYSFCRTNVTGTYIYDYYDNTGAVYVNSFDITSLGKPVTTGGILVFFVIIFLVLISLIGYLAIFNLGRLLSLDFDIADFAKNFGLYTAIVVLYFLEQYYINNPMMDDILLRLVQWSWTIFIVVPIVALVLTITIGSLKHQRPYFGNTNASKRRMFRV